MKRICIFIVTVLATLSINAQDNQRFSPEKFEAKLQEFITQEAKLTTQEAEAFFPIYKQMLAKQREVFDRQRQLGRNKPADEAGCLKAIKDRDTYDLELKTIQQTYHNRFLELLPASKVYDILKAEDRFHRQMMHQWGNRHRQQGQQQQRR